MPLKLKMPAAIGRLLMTPGKRYYGLKGGRGSAKSASVAQWLLLDGMSAKQRVLCAREVQNSIKESSHAEISKWVDELGLGWFYQVGESFIRGANGTEFIYRGLLRNMDSVKSMSGITRVWIEEAENVSQLSLDKLDPTIRAAGAKIYITWNPELKDSPVSKLLEGAGELAAWGHFNYDANPFFPPELEALRLKDRERDYDRYLHIWEGQPLTRSDAQVLAGKWQVDEFTPGDDWNGPYFGADWGFATDPTALVKFWIYRDRLYIEHELVKHGLEIRNTATEFKKMPGLLPREGYGYGGSKIIADNARPETISHVRSEALDVVACDKWPGSVEDGVEYLRGKYDQIIIHPRCTETIREARLWSYKVDKLTDEVLPVLVDKNNHCWDAIRYGHGNLIKRKGRGFFG